MPTSTLPQMRTCSTLRRGVPKCSIHMREGRGGDAVGGKLDDIEDIEVDGRQRAEMMKPTTEYPQGPTTTTTPSHECLVEKMRWQQEFSRKKNNQESHQLTADWQTHTRPLQREAAAESFPSKIDIANALSFSICCSIAFRSAICCWSCIATCTRRHCPTLVCTCSWS